MKYLLIVFFIVISNNLFAQEKHTKEKSFIIKCEYMYDNIYTESTVSYCILKLSKIDSMQVDTNFCDDQCVVYEITKYGGYYAIDGPNDIYTQACCRSGNINYFMSSIDSVKMINESGDKHLIELLNKRILDKRKGVNYSYNDNVGKYIGIYRLSVWIADLDYCVCDVFMGGLTQRIYGKRVAYLTNLSHVQKINKIQKKKISNYFDRLFDSILKGSARR